MYLSNHLLNFTDEEIRRWIYIRAIEWASYPSFISQPIFPILLIFFDWWKIIIVLFCLEILWSFIRYRYFNPFISSNAVYFVKLKWPLIIVCLIYFILAGKYFLAALSLFWPLIVGFIGLPGKIGIIELFISDKIGYTSNKDF
jgi:hypothetical protein